jgi:uncharacterized membrane protein YgcG
MDASKRKFLKRRWLYNTQYILATIIPPMIWYVLITAVYSYPKLDTNDLACFMGIGLVPTWFYIFNTVTYFYGKLLIRRYGSEIFSGIDPKLLKEHWDTDAKTFGEDFAYIMKYRKIGGLYPLTVIALAAIIGMYWATAAAFLCFFGYIAYRINDSDDYAADGFFSYEGNHGRNIPHFGGKNMGRHTSCGNPRHDSGFSGAAMGGSMFNHVFSGGGSHSPGGGCSSFNWGKAHIGGTREANMTGNIFCR